MRGLNHKTPAESEEELLAQVAAVVDVGLAVLFLQPIASFFLLSFMPRILAVGNPSDTPQRYKVPIVGLWFEEKHYYLIVIIWGIQSLLGTTTLAATESLAVIFTMHACGMLSVAW
ncbi:hypothetical protein KM043_018769 [Ampulex compressa]|nr:hypothetical protein KM043_018769 [Ampulex compressa]